MVDVEAASLTPMETVTPVSRCDDQSDGDIQAWLSIRTSIGVFDSLVMNLLTQGTVLVLAALGVIFGAGSNLSSSVMIMLGGGVVFGVVMLHLGVSRYATSISVAATAAKELEDRLWPDKSAPNRISHRLAGHALAASRRLGRIYYRLWSYLLLALVIVMVVVLSIDSRSREASTTRPQPPTSSASTETPNPPSPSPDAPTPVGSEPSEATEPTADLPHNSDRDPKR